MQLNITGKVIDKQLVERKNANFAGAQKLFDPTGQFSEFEDKLLKKIV